MFLYQAAWMASVWQATVDGIYFAFPRPAVVARDYAHRAPSGHRANSSTSSVPTGFLERKRSLAK
jgi:hypothetical protein